MTAVTLVGGPWNGYGVGLLTPSPREIVLVDDRFREHVYLREDGRYVYQSLAPSAADETQDESSTLKLNIMMRDQCPDLIRTSAVSSTAPTR